MTGKTHIIGGIATGLAFAQITNYEPVLLLGAGAVGAIIPDICHGGSKIGRTFPVVSRIINTLFGHRTFTHSLIFLMLAALLFNAFLPNEAISAGLLAGMASHLLLDMATKKGIKLFFPFKITVRLPVTTKTGSAAESVIFAALSLLSVYFGMAAFGFYY